LRNNWKKQWRIADEQTTDDVLKQALDWACSPGGADCTMIQPNKSWYLPNTVRYHASMPSTTTGKSSRKMLVLAILMQLQ
jgi:hypothetical protein